MILSGGKLKTAYKKNCLFPIQQDDLEIIKKSIADSADKWIFSKRPLCEEEIGIIKEVCEKKTQDEEPSTSEE